MLYILIRCFSLLILLTSLLTACATDEEAPPPKVTVNNPNAQVALAEAANSISHSLNQLNAIEQASRPHLKLPTPYNPAEIGMAQLASIDWNGPIKPVLREIAKTTHYRLSVLGRRPAIPVIVSLREHNRPIAEILRNISLQAAKQADIVLYPRRKLIELRYHNV